MPPGTLTAGQQVRAVRLNARRSWTRAAQAASFGSPVRARRRVAGAHGTRPGDQVSGVMPGHSHLASITAGWGRYIRKITNHGWSAEVGSQFGSRSLPGEPGCR